MSEGKAGKIARVRHHPARNVIDGCGNTRHRLVLVHGPDCLSDGLRQRPCKEQQALRPSMLFSARTKPAFVAGSPYLGNSQ